MDNVEQELINFMNDTNENNEDKNSDETPAIFNNAIDINSNSLDNIENNYSEDSDGEIDNIEEKKVETFISHDPQIKSDFRFINNPDSDVRLGYKPLEPPFNFGFGKHVNNTNKPDYKHSNPSTSGFAFNNSENINYTTENFTQTETTNNNDPFPLKFNNCNSGFNYEEFNKRILFKMIANDSEIGEHIRDMNININKITRDELDFLKNVISNLEEYKFRNNIEVKNCSCVIQFVSSISKILIPEEYETLENDLQSIKNSIESYDYNLNIISELSSKGADLKFNRIKPTARLSTMLIQIGVVYAMKKVPKIIEKYLNKDNKEDNKRKNEDNDEIYSKKRKI